MLALRSTPICLTMSRCTSATVTFSITWSRPRTVIELTILSAPPTSRAARSPACCASIGLAAEPVDLDVGVGQRLLQRGAHAVEVTLDRDVVGGDLLARGIEEHDVGLADRGADDVSALRGADPGVGGLAVGDDVRCHAIAARQPRRQRRIERERRDG